MRFFLLHILFLGLFVDLSAWAGNPPTRHNEVEVHTRDCNFFFGQIAQAKAKGPVRGMKNHFAEQQLFEEMQQRTYIDKATSPTPGGTFLHFENSILKQMSEEIFLDRELAQAITRMAKSILVDKLRASAIGKHDFAVYSDFKSLRVWIDAPPKEVEGVLRKVYNETNYLFEATLQNNRELKKIFDAHTTKFSTPKTWFLAGMGRDAERAAWGARFARTVVKKGMKSDEKHVGIIGADNVGVSKIIEESAKKIEALRKKSLLALKNHGSFEKETLTLENGEEISAMIPSVNLLSLLKEVPQDFKNTHIDTFTKAYEQVFGHPLSTRSALDLVEYFKKLDGFMPALHVHSDEPLHYDVGEHGVVALDYVGQGVRNVQAASRALIKASSAPLGKFESRSDKLLRLFREEQTESSFVFEKSLGIAARTLRDFPIEGDRVIYKDEGVFISGDDVLFAPKTEMKTPDKIELLKALSSRIPPGNFRVIFLPGSFKIPQSPNAQSNDKHLQSYETAELLQKSEVIAKTIKKELMRLLGEQNKDGTLTSPVGKPPRVLIAIDLHSVAIDVGTFKIYLGGEVSPKVKAMALTVLKDFFLSHPEFDGFRFDDIDVTSLAH